LVESFRKELGQEAQIIDPVSPPSLVAVASLSRSGAQAIFIAASLQDIVPYAQAARKEQIPIITVVSPFVTNLKNWTFDEAKNVYVIGATSQKGSAIARDLFAKYGHLDDSVLYGYTAATILFSAVDDGKTIDGFALARLIRSRSWNSPLGPLSFDNQGNAKGLPLTVWLLETNRVRDLEFRP